MALNMEKGVISSPVSTGVQTYNLPANFDPKLLIVWTTEQGSEGDSVNGILSLGVATYEGSVAQQGGTSETDTDAVDPTQVARATHTGFLLKGFDTSTTPVVDYEVDFDSFVLGASSSFKLNWVDLPASTIKIHYWIWGGSDVDKARVINGNITNVDNQDITIASGWGQPDLIFFIADMNWVEAPVLGNQNTCFGWGIDDANRRCTLLGRRNGTTNVTIQQFQTSRLAALTSADTAECEVELGAKINWPIDGFRLVKPDLPTGSRYFIALCIQGTFQKIIGSTSSPTGVAPQTQDLAAGFAPKGAFLWGWPLATTAGFQTAGAELGSLIIGALDGTNEGCSVNTQDDQAGASVADRSHSESKAIKISTFGPALKAEADSSFSGNNLRLIWSTTDTGLAREFNYVIIGAAAAGDVTVISPAGIATGSSVAPIPLINLIDVIGSSTASIPTVNPEISIVAISVATANGLTPALIIDVFPPISSADAQIVSSVLEIAVSGIGVATAQISAPTFIIDSTISAPVAISTASSISPIPEILVTGIGSAIANIVIPILSISIVSPIGDSNAVALVPIVGVTVTIISPAAISVASIDSSILKIDIVSPVGSISAVAPVPLVGTIITVASPSAVATAQVNNPIPIISISPSTANAVSESISPVPEVLVIGLTGSVSANSIAPVISISSSIVAPAGQATAIAPIPLVFTGAGVIVQAVPGIAYAEQRVRVVIPFRNINAQIAAPVISTSATVIIVSPIASATAIAVSPGVRFVIGFISAVIVASATTCIPEIKVDLSYDEAAGGGLTLGLVGFPAGIDLAIAKADRSIPISQIIISPSAATSTAQVDPPSVVGINSPAATANAQISNPLVLIDILVPFAEAVTLVEDAVIEVKAIGLIAEAIASSSASVEVKITPLAASAGAVLLSPILIISGVTTVRPPSGIAIAVQVSIEPSLVISAPTSISTCIRLAPSKSIFVSVPIAQGLALANPVIPNLRVTCPVSLIIGSAVSPILSVRAFVTVGIAQTISGIPIPEIRIFGIATISTAQISPSIPIIKVSPSSYLITAIAVSPSLFREFVVSVAALSMLANAIRSTPAVDILNGKDLILDAPKYLLGIKEESRLFGAKEEDSELIGTQLK